MEKEKVRKNLKDEITELKNDLFNKKADHNEIINKILGTNESISRELEMYKEKYDYMKEKNLILKKELNDIKSSKKQIIDYEEEKIKEFLSTKSKGNNQKQSQKENSMKKFNQNDVNNNLNSSNMLHNQNNSTDSQFLDTTSKKIFSNILPEEKKYWNKQSLNYDYQTLPHDENLFIDNMVRDAGKIIDNKVYNKL